MSIISKFEERAWHHILGLKNFWSCVWISNNHSWDISHFYFFFRSNNCSWDQTTNSETMNLETDLIVSALEYFPPLNSFRTCMYCEQRSQYIRLNSKKNSFRGNYLQKYSRCIDLIHFYGNSIVGYVTCYMDCGLLTHDD